MMAEHMPDRLLRVLQRLAKQRTGDPQVLLFWPPFFPYIPFCYCAVHSALYTQICLSSVYCMALRCEVSAPQC